MSTVTTCREYAKEWVHLYAAGGAAWAVLSGPVATSAGLMAVETYMIYGIGKIYGEELSGREMLMVGGTLDLASVGLKTLTIEACNFLPVARWLVKGSIAAAAIESIGRLVIRHFERKYPGKLYAPGLEAREEAERPV
jgi:uncharacterized protein (DUF697 family)